jgi:cytochrome c peroxidase
MSKHYWQIGPAFGLLIAASSGCTDELDVGRSTSALAEDEQFATPNHFGVAATYSTLGPVDLNNMFFRTDLGTNGRSCATCHDPRSGWGISAELANELFDASDGLDPLFRIHDAGTRPDAPTGTLAERKQTYKPVYKDALIRFGQTVSAAAEFEVIAVDDPSGFGTPAAHTRFRRPNPMSNEAFVASVTWTGGPHDVFTQLKNLVNGANVFHAQGSVVPVELREEAALLSLSVFHAQVEDDKAGRLDADGAMGGPVHLASQEFFIGINTGESFNPRVFNVFDAWESSPNEHRRAIWRGQEVFNTKTFGNGGHCGNCHNTPNVGSSSTFTLRRVGTDVPSEFTDKLVKLTIRNKTTGDVKVVTDLGRGLTTGLWNDVGRFKVQHLRGLASRAPFFHDGRAKNLNEVIDHYEAFFNIQFTGTEKEDLAAFLYAL